MNSGAVRAKSYKVETVMLGAETDLLRRVGHGVGDRSLEPVGGRKVVDAAAVGAHEMMVVSRERFGEFVTGELVVGDDAVHDARLFQHDQVPVHRTLREVALMFEDLGDREGPVGRGKYFEQARPNRSHPLLLLVEPTRDGVAQLVGNATHQLASLPARCGLQRRDTVAPWSRATGSSRW